MKSTPIVYQGNLHPPFSDKVTQVKRAGFGTRLKKFLTLLVGGIFLSAIPIVIGALFDITWLMWAGVALFGLILLMMVFDKTHKGECPYCGQHFTIETGEMLEKKKWQVECQHCHEWLLQDGVELRAFTEEDAKELKKFKAPVFEKGRWPNECIVCGNPHVRLDALNTTKLNASALLLGAISTSSAKVFDVPYCAEHGDALKLKIVDDHPRIIFKDFATQRRYLAVNKGLKPVKVK